MSVNRDNDLLIIQTEQEPQRQTPRVTMATAPIQQQRIETVKEMERNETKTF